MEPMTIVYAIAAVLGVWLAIHLFRKGMMYPASFAAALSGMHGANVFGLDGLRSLFTLVVLLLLIYGVYCSFLKR